MRGVDDYAKALAEYGEVLADRVEAALPAWVEAAVTRTMAAWAGGGRDSLGRDSLGRGGGGWDGALDPGTAEATAAAAAAAARETGAALRALVRADVDAQASTPLAIVRAAVRWPTEVLRAAGVAPVQRDRFDEAVFPDDDYALTPATLADLAPDLAEVALAWGAAKAWVHKHRHSGS